MFHIELLLLLLFATSHLSAEFICGPLKRLAPQDLTIIHPCWLQSVVLLERGHFNVRRRPVMNMRSQSNVPVSFPSAKGHCDCLSVCVLKSPALVCRAAEVQTAGAPSAEGEGSFVSRSMRKRMKASEVQARLIVKESRQLEGQKQGWI